MDQAKREHYQMLLGERRQKMMPISEANAQDPVKDRSGCYTASLARNYRFIGMTEYLLSRDVQAFRTNLSKCASLYLSLFRRFDAGEPVDASYVTMLAYDELYDALAAGDMRLADELARVMGGREAIEKKHDHPFDYAMGYALKAAVLDDGGAAVERLKSVCDDPDNANFRGYVAMFDGILQRDVAMVEKGAAMVIERHPKEAKRGVFHGTVNEDLCVWGIGACNLARSRGLPIQVDHELIPAELLI